MTKDELNAEYFAWMYGLVFSGDYARRLSYRKLLWHLFYTEFTYTIPMDGNREDDGINLRYQFGDENGYSQNIISSYLDDRPCSVLEMMVALAVRCEVHIMGDPDIGDRTGKWFWSMITNLGLDDMDNGHFDLERFQAIVERFLTHKYQRNGAGGLFTVHQYRRDMRKVEIWYQMCWYLNENM